MSPCISSGVQGCAACTVQVSTRNTTGQAHYGCTGAFTCLCLSDICCFTPSGPADIMYPCLDSDICFFWTWWYFYRSSALFFKPLCDSHSVTHCQVDSLYNLLWLFTSPVWNILVLPNHLFPHKFHLFLLCRHFLPYKANNEWDLSGYLYLIWGVCWHTNQPNPLEVWNLPCTQTSRCWPLFLALAQLKIFKVCLFCNKFPLSSMTVSKVHLALLSTPSFRLLFQGIE